MRKTSAAQETDSPQPGLFDELGQSNAEDPQAKNGSATGPSRTNPGIAEQNANPQTEGPMREAVPPQPTENPTGADTQAAVDLVESEAPRETPPIGELTHSSLQSGTAGLAGIPTIGAAPDHPDDPNAVVNGYAPHAGDQRSPVPVTEATGSKTDAPREPEDADRSALEAQNGELSNNDREESGGGDEFGRTGALDEDSATEGSFGATAPTISPDPAAVAAAADSPEGSATNQLAEPDQPGTAPSNGTTISPDAGPKKGSPSKKMIKRRFIKVHPDVEVILRQTGLFDLWQNIWRRQTGPTKTKMALLKGAGVQALLAATELRAIKKQDEYLCYSNTWIFRHLERMLAPDEQIAVEVHAKVSREQLRNEVLNEYLLRPVYYRVPAKRFFGLRLLASMRTLAASGLFHKMTLDRFQHWAGFSKASMSESRKKQ